MIRRRGHHGQVYLRVVALDALKPLDGPVTSFYVLLEMQTLAPCMLLRGPTNNGSRWYFSP